MWRKILAVGGILIALPAMAPAAAAGLGDCAAIKDAAARLACYDGLDPQPAAVPKPAPAAAAPPTAPAAAAPAAPVVAAPQAELPAAAGTEKFGAETLPNEVKFKAVPDEITSRISGQFKGWSKETEFQLDNGQVWRCVDCREVYHWTDSPTVTIRRNFAGTYWLKVDGLNSQAKVKRLR